MPEIPDRAALEAHMARELKRLRGVQRERLLAYLGRPPNPERVPESFWREIEEEDHRQWMLLLMPIAMQAAQRTAAMLGLRLPDAMADSLVRPHVASRADYVSREAVKHTRSRFGDLIKELKAKALTGKAGADDTGMIDAMFGDARSETQAVTEATQANSMGDLSAAEAARAGDLPEMDEPAPPPEEPRESRRRTVEAIWRTEPDDRVCPICRPLHGQPEESWSQVYPDGPPGHPNCRCVLEIRGGRQDGKQFRAN